MVVARLSPAPPQFARPLGVDRIRWALALGLLLLAVGVLVTGERPATLSHLEDAVATGRVQQVAVTPGLGPGETGYATQQARWREGLFRYHTTITQASSGVHVPEVEAAQVRHADLATLLRRQRPGVEVTTGHWSSSSSWEIFGWQTPGWMALFAITEWLCCLALVSGGPHPWRATRWAWFWLICHPVGMAAFLLLSGRTPGLSPPRRGARRMTGGWAFLALLVLYALT